MDDDAFAVLVNIAATLNEIRDALVKQKPKTPESLKSWGERRRGEGIVE